MFDIGFWEMLLIGVVALVVIGPERLPTVARTLGRWTAKLRNFVANTRADLEKEFNSEEIHKLLNDKQGEIDELRSMLNETRASIEQAKDQYIVRAMDDEKPSETKSETTEADSVKGNNGKA
jgi:sec-independent protein translocase protein TatB